MDEMCRDSLPNIEQPILHISGSLHGEPGVPSSLRRIVWITTWRRTTRAHGSLFPSIHEENLAIASRFGVVHHWRGVTDPERCVNGERQMRTRLLTIVLSPLVALILLSCEVAGNRAAKANPPVQKNHPAYLAGASEAEQEWEAGEATIYLYGLLNRYDCGLDKETGLVTKQIAGDFETELTAIRNREAGHNDRIKELIAKHGRPKYSRKKWVDEIFDSDRYYHEQEQRTEPTILAVNGGVFETTTCLLRLVGTPTGDPDGSVYVRIEMKTGQRTQEIEFPLGHYAAERTELVMGPDGSDLVFFQWSRFGKWLPDIESVFGVLDMRSGMWIRAKILRKQEGSSGTKVQSTSRKTEGSTQPSGSRQGRDRASVNNRISLARRA
jgi:hypothetical protein